MIKDRQCRQPNMAHKSLTDNDLTEANYCMLYNDSKTYLQTRQYNRLMLEMFCH